MASDYLINIADMECPDDAGGRTYRQINAARSHSYDIGALVELDGGARLFVVHHGRDCDQTPLYYLSADSDDTEQENPRFKNPTWLGGYSEHGLTLVKYPKP